MKWNITLIGLPGSGKTTLGKLLANKLWKTFVDFDDDIIEKQCGKSVAAILNEVGEIWLKI